MRITSDRLAASVMAVISLLAWSSSLTTPAGSYGGSEPAAFSDGKAGFSIKVGGSRIPYKIMMWSLLPGAELLVETPGARSGESFEVTDSHGNRAPARDGRWTWRAPESPGLNSFVISRAGTDETITLQVFVLVPAAKVKDGFLDGYMIGAYPKTALRGLDIYKPPSGFVQVTPENQETRISPHFKLRDFLCKQAGAFPKYVLIRPRLLMKLELLLQHVNAAGYRCDTFFVMSGFRTPFYNHAIGNVKYSRHVWGGAADIFIDQSPRDGVMDDLNKDGKIDYKDAAVLYDLVDGLYGKQDYEPFVGGLGRYKKTASHGPFVHVDVRGFRARWGT